MAATVRHLFETTISVIIVAILSRVIVSEREVLEKSIASDCGKCDREDDVSVAFQNGFGWRIGGNFAEPARRTKTPKAVLRLGHNDATFAAANIGARLTVEFCRTWGFFIATSVS